MHASDRRLLLACIAVVGAIGLLVLVGHEVSGFTIGAYGFLVVVGLASLNVALRAQGWPKFLLAWTAVLLSVVTLVSVTYTGVTDAHETLQLRAAAKAEAEQRYPEVLAELTRQGFIPGAYDEVPAYNQRLEEVNPDAVRVFLKHRATRLTVVLNVHRLDRGWTVVCPLTDGGWLASYERDNWLATQLALSGDCPAGIR